MQVAHSTSDFAAFVFGAAAAVLPPCVGVVVETLATEGEPDPVPPHAASPRAIAATASANMTDRR